MGIIKNSDISFLGAFRDKDLEKEFFDYYMKRAVRYISPVVLAMGILFMLFIIPDRFLIKNPDTFLFILINRIVFLALVIALYITIRKTDNYIIVANFITVCEILATTSFLLILNKYESPDFLIQSFGVMVIILAVFTTPNKWINKLFVSIMISILFCISSLYNFDNLAISKLSAGFVYILITIIIMSIYSHNSNYYIRKHYIDSHELIKLSVSDPLTGIYNRAKVEEELERWIDYSKRYNAPFSLILFDIDNFKLINDNFGHFVGDRTLLDTVKVIESEIRQSDIFARWGGDEFVILLPNTNELQAKELTERLRNSIKSNRYEIIEVITCSFGLVTYSINDTADSLLQMADKLLYKAKKSGKDIIVSNYIK